MIPPENRPISIHSSRGVSEWPVVSSIFYFYSYSYFFGGLLTSCEF